MKFMKQVASSALSSYSLYCPQYSLGTARSGGEIIRRAVSSYRTSCRADLSFVNVEDIKAIECPAGSLQIGSSSTIRDNTHIFAV